MKRQTALEWFAERIKHGGLVSNKQFDELLKQANKMFEKQVKDAYDQGSEAGYVLAKNDDFIEGFKMKEAEQYYNETFKTK
jgi:hypothetical protein